MKFTKQILKQLIREELGFLLSEQSARRADPNSLRLRRSRRNYQSNSNYDPSQLAPAEDEEGGDSLAELEERLTREMNEMQREVFKQINTLKKNQNALIGAIKAIQEELR